MFICRVDNMTNYEKESRVDYLGKELAKQKMENVKKDKMIQMLGKQIAMLKMEGASK